MAKREKKSIKNKPIVLLGVLAIIVVIVWGVLALTGEDKKDNGISDSNKKEVEILAVGDNIFHDAIIAYGKQENGSYNFDGIYSEIKKNISSADIAIVNQETILGGDVLPYKGYPVFNTPWEAGEALMNAGFDVFTCASNHAMDSGEKALKGAFEFFKQHQDVKEVGLNKSKEEYDTVDYYEKNGIKFAFLNYSYGTNGISQPKGKPWTVNLLDKEKIAQDLKEARKKADVVIVFPHWGTEYSTEVDATQKEYTKLFSDLGADVVIGTHPHVIEKVEWVESEKTGKKTLVYYSLGNFVSNQPDAIMQLGAMAKIKVIKTDKGVEIKEAKAIPIVTHVEDHPKEDNHATEVKVYKLSDYTDELAKKNHSKSSVKWFKETAEKILGEFIETSQ